MPEWTKETPTEHGWYWWKKYEESYPQPAAVSVAGAYFHGEARIRPGEGFWWPERLQEPE